MNDQNPDRDLARAVRALREQGDQPAPQARTTRERILRDLRPRARGRRAAWLIPIAALLAGSTVLAATGALPRALHAAARVLGLEAPPADGAARPGAPSGARVAAAPEAPSSARADSPTPDAPAAPETPAAPVAPAPVVPAPSSTAPADDAVAPAPDRSGRVRAPRADAGAPKHTVAPEQGAVAEPPSSAPSSAAQDPGTLALYRRARQLHFVEQKPAEALAAWDAYLAAEPRGPLAVDARYDRALCLVRLGRHQEARAALRPFADGAYGTYRQSEARALIDALP